MKKRTLYILITWLVGWIGCGGFGYAIIKNMAGGTFDGMPLVIYHLTWSGIATYLTYYFKTRYTENGEKIVKPSAPPTYQAPVTRTEPKPSPSPVSQTNPQPGQNTASSYCKVTVHGIDPTFVWHLANVPFRSAFTPPSPQPVAGYRFVGWYYDTALTREFLSSDSITGDTELFAKYLPIGPDEGENHEMQ